MATRTIPLVLLTATLLAQAPNTSPQAPSAQGTQAKQAPPNNDLGYTDTPMLPGLPYHVHDPARPHPPVVTPAAKPGDPPSDAIILFDGRDASHFTFKGAQTWKIENGHMEVVPGAGDATSKEFFGDIQLHVEFAAPNPPKNTSQNRGNSGIYLQGLYEVQVLDDWDNPTYADGQTGAIYGQWPPLANPARQPGEWQAYDILFEAPRFNADNSVRAPAYVTVLLNGVLLHHHKEILGPTVHRALAKYTGPHSGIPAGAPDMGPLVLQDHSQPVRYRNIWVRRLNVYDQKEK